MISLKALYKELQKRATYRCPIFVPRLIEMHKYERKTHAKLVCDQEIYVIT